MFRSQPLLDKASVNEAARTRVYLPLFITVILAEPVQAPVDSGDQSGPNRVHARRPPCVGAIAIIAERFTAELQQAGPKAMSRDLGYWSSQ